MGTGNLGLDPTPGTGTDPVESCNRINFHRHTGNPGEGDQINAADIIVEPSGDITANNQADANAQLNSLANLGRKHVEVRQTVLKGHSTNGTPDFLEIGSGLSVNIAATSKHVVIAFAVGYDDDYGAIDYIGKIAEDRASYWSNLPANATVFLYIDRNQLTGILTPGYSTLAPIYQKDRTISTIDGQHTFDFGDMTMYVGNGSNYSAVQRVFIGECITGSDSITADPISYAFKGHYLSEWFPVTINSNYTKNHNIGIKIPDGLQIQFYFSMDLSGTDATFAHDAYKQSDGSVVGHMEIENIQNNTCNYLKVGFGSGGVQFYRGVTRLSGYYRLLIKRGW